MTTSPAQPRRAILVTGAASGIGAATARRFIKEGWQVAINCIDQSQREAASAIAATASAPGQQSIVLEGDVTRDADCQSLVERTVAAFGPVQLLPKSSLRRRHGPEDVLEVAAQRRWRPARSS